MKVLSKSEILAAQDLKTTTVEVPEWGGAVLVRSLSGDERDAWEIENARRRDRLGAAADKYSNLDGIRARLAALCLCDESGARLFTPAEVTELGRKSGAALDRVFDAARALNGMLPDQETELGKASGICAPSAGPGSATPSPTAAP